MNEDNAKIKIYYDELRNLYELRKNAPNEDELKKINDGIANINLNINVMRLKANDPKYRSIVKGFNDFRSKINDLRLEGLYSECVAAICIAPDGFVGASVSIQGNEQEFSHVNGFIQAALALGIDLRGNEKMSVYELGELITSHNEVVYQTMNGYVIAYLPSNLTKDQCLAASSVLTKFKDCMISTLQNGETQDCIDFDTVQDILKQSVLEPKKLSR